MITLSIILISIAHYIRTIRWKLLITTYEKTDNKNLMSAISIGYFINYLLPFKIGDLIRAYIAGKNLKNGFAFSVATVVIDRLMDILTVGLLFMLFYAVGFYNGSYEIKFYIYLGCGMLIGMAFIWHFRKYVKKGIKTVASIFNERIEFSILKFFWALIWIFQDIVKRINKWKFLGSTFLMWLLYLSSYACFAKCLSLEGEDVKTVDIFYALFAKDSMRMSSFGLAFSTANFTISTQTIYYFLFLLMPTVFLFILSLILKRSGNANEQDEGQYLNLIPHLDHNERLKFLEIYFSSEQNAYIQGYLKINQNVLVIRDYSAGSNASTMLCMHNNEQFFRKYAFEGGSDKLYRQIEWIRRFKDILPLPEIIRCDRQSGYCFYDMPYKSNSIGLFEYSHSMPRENAWRFIRETLECLESTIYKINMRKADKNTIEEYIESKVNKNIEKIMSAKYIKNLMDYENIYINGHSFKNLKYYLKYLNAENLYEIFKDDTYSEIHGDLTIENIICTRDIHGKDGFYIIDPNTGNVHDSSNLDYAKLLQSIHGGYEFLMATQNIDVNKNRINFIFTKSETYNYLYNMLDGYMNDNFSRERVRSIYYHEIIHWLRLMPYKIEKNGRRSLLFYAGMLMVMNDVVMKFGGGAHEG